MEYREGQTATNPKTGQRLIYRNGQWTNAGTVAGAAKPTSAEVKQQINNRNSLADLVSVERQINRLDELYKKDFKGVGPGSLLEYLPTPARKRFDAAGNGMRPLLKPLIREPGEGSWTEGDQALLDSLIPTGSAQDSETEERINNIRALIRDKRNKYGGNAPAKGWSIRRIK